MNKEAQLWRIRFLLALFASLAFLQCAPRSSPRDGRLQKVREEYGVRAFSEKLPQGPWVEGWSMESPVVVVDIALDLGQWLPGAWREPELFRLRQSLERRLVALGGRLMFAPGSSHVQIVLPSDLLEPGVRLLAEELASAREAPSLGEADSLGLLLEGATHRAELESLLGRALVGEGSKVDLCPERAGLIFTGKLDPSLVPRLSEWLAPWLSECRPSSGGGEPLPVERRGDVWIEESEAGRSWAALAWVIPAGDADALDWSVFSELLLRDAGAPFQGGRPSAAGRWIEPFHLRLGASFVAGFFLEGQSDEVSSAIERLKQGTLHFSDPASPARPADAVFACKRALALAQASPSSMAAALGGMGLNGALALGENWSALLRACDAVGGRLPELLSRLRSASPLMVGRGVRSEAKALAAPDATSASLSEFVPPADSSPSPSWAGPPWHGWFFETDGGPPLVAAALRVSWGTSDKERLTARWALRGMLLGTSWHSSPQLEERLWRLGCKLSAVEEERQGGFDLLCMESGFAEGFEILREIFAHPSFPDSLMSQGWQELLQDWNQERSRLLVRVLEPSPASELSSSSLPVIDDVRALQRGWTEAGAVRLAIVGASIPPGIRSELSHPPQASQAQGTPWMSQEQGSERQEALPIEGAWFALENQAPPLGSPDEAAMQVLLELLKGGSESFLSQALEGHWPLWVSAEYQRQPFGEPGPPQEPGRFFVTWGGSSEHFEASKRALLSLFEQVRTQTFSDLQIQEARRRVLAAWSLQGADLLGLAHCMLWREGGRDLLDRWAQELAAPKAEDLRSVAQRYWSRDWRASSVLPLQ